MPNRFPLPSNDNPLIGAAGAGPPVKLANVLAVPLVELNTDSWPLDWLPEKKIVPDEFKRCTAAMAVMSYVLADLP